MYTISRDYQMLNERTFSDNCLGRTGSPMGTRSAANR